jgi:hypothetical protein
MAEQQNPLPVQLGEDENVTSIMVYTEDYLFWGDVVTKKVIRVSTWLRTNAAPDSVCIYNATAMLPNGSTSIKPTTFSELHLPVGQILCYHILPPAKDPLDYDPREENRRMQDISAIVGQFRMDGQIRMATRIDLKRYLEVSREVFTALYDVSVSHPLMANFNLPKIPFLLVRQTTTAFSIRIQPGQTPPIYL